VPRHFTRDHRGQMRDHRGHNISYRGFVREVEPGDTFERENGRGKLVTAKLIRKTYIDAHGQETDRETARGRCVLVSTTTGGDPGD